MIQLVSIENHGRRKREKREKVEGDYVPKKKGRGRPASTYSDHPFHVCCSRPKLKGMISLNWDTGEAAEFFKSYIDGDHQAESMDAGKMDLYN